MVPKQELSEQVWQGRFISDATLESTLAAVRGAIGDRGRGSRYIHTLHGHGYRFVAPVEERADPSPNAASAASLPVGEAPRGAPSVSVKGVADNVLASQEATARNLGPPPGAGERKLVSVLCCGLSRTLGSGARVDLDSLHQEVRELYDLVRREVRRYGGTVQSVVGERVLAVFGLPAAQEDHAQRAVLAALGLQQRLQQVPTAGGRTPTPWPLGRMSVHTGPMAVGGLSREEAAALAVVGETVTHAIALPDAAAPGVILCSAAMARLVRELVRLEAIAPETQPRLPTPVYRIVGFRICCSS